MKLKDDLRFGLALGFALPLIVVSGIYLLQFGNYPVGDFFSILKQQTRLITFFAAWCLVANIALFTLFVNTKKDRTAKGVFIMTVVWGLGFLLLRYLI